MRGGPGGQRELVHRAKVVLGAHVSSRVPVAVLARHLGCSVFHLCRTFRRLEGRTISDYRAQLRLRLALQRLRDAPDSDLTELALECGYCSHSHFTSSFRRRLGTTPSAFAEAINAPARTRASADPCGRCSR